MLNKYEGLSDIHFEEGDILDANSIKMYIKYLSGFDNVVTFDNKASNTKFGIIKCGDTINVQDGVMNIERISEQFIHDLR